MSPPDTTPEQAVERLLEGWLGLDPGTVGSAAIRRAVQTRMKAIGTDTPAAYLEILGRGRTERDNLVEEVVVAESWFFRDRQVFDFFRGFLTKVTASPGRMPVRILCAPCAGGEEPYSVAMAALAAGLAPVQFVIDAVDVSRKALGRAERGVYSSNAFRNPDLSFRDLWFRIENGSFTIDEAVRQCVRFRWGNIVDPGFVEGFVEGLGGPGPAYDVIFCRNLLIYLTGEARGRVEASLDRLLAADGLLVVGAAEPATLRGRWVPVADSSVFALRRSPPGDASLPRTIPPAVGIRHRAARSPTPAAADPPPASIGETAVEPGQRLPSLDDVLHEAGSLANARRFGDALACCERHLEQSGPSAELFFLMGMIHQSAGDLDRAEICLHKTVYLDAAHEDALLALALSATRRGDLAMADRYRQSAARASSRKAAS